MGQRHQLFIISNVNGRYRTLAAVHHQWLYGAGPTKACWRMLQILQNPTNKKLISHELREAATHPDEWWKTLKRDSHWQDDPLQFPFITTCLVLGAGLDPRPQFVYRHDVQVLSITTDFEEVDNNDGLTMIDISNLDSIRYCFLQLGSRGMRPLTGMQYYLGYYRELSSSAPQPADLTAWGLIDTESLKDLWPHGKWKPPKATDTTPTDEVVATAHIKSLRSHAFEKLIEQALDDPGSGRYLANAEMIPDFQKLLREYVDRDRNVIRRPGGMQVLIRVAQRGNLLDLSFYSWLTEAEILEVVEKQPLATEITSIDLSTNAMVGVEAVQKILKICPNVTKLIVLCTDNIPLLPLLDLLDVSKVREVVHSDLFRRPLSSQEYFPTEENISTSEQISNHLGFFTGAGGIIRQAISIRASPHFDGTAYRLPDGGLQWSDILIDKSTWTAMDSGRSFDPMTRASAIPLLDAMLEPLDVLDWFHQLLSFFGGSPSGLAMLSLSNEEDDAIRCAEYLSISTMDMWKIKPLSSNLYMRRNFPLVRTTGRHAANPCYVPIQHNEWTVLMIVEQRFSEDRNPAFWSEIRYAFLTRDRTNDLVVANIKEFYRMAIGSEILPDAKATELEQQINSWGDALYESWLYERGRAGIALDERPDNVLRFCCKDEVEEIVTNILEAQLRNTVHTNDAE